MNHIRVRMENVENMTAALESAGFQATWRPGAFGTWGNGCTDPGCCTPHPEAICYWTNEEDKMSGVALMDSTKWATIETNCSGNKAHKIWTKAGII